MDNESKDKVAVKLYNRKLFKYAIREDRAIKRMHADKTAAHSFFVVNKRYTNGQTSDRMVFMDQYPFTLTNWAWQSPPISVLKLQLHMLVRGVAYCHAKGIAHRDIKTDNVMIGYDLVPKLIDFGLSSIEGEPFERHDGGTRLYKAPEILMNTMMQTLKGAKRTDCWSLGITIYRAIYNDMPFGCWELGWKEYFKEKKVPAIEVSDLELAFIKKDKKLPKDYQLANDLIRGLLEVDVNKRKTAAESIDHPFFKEWSYS